ncbi:MAG: type III-A CRISPR-associated RAMP protein Csm5 [Bacteroidetes bacterium]|nr:type III-A CRISPR-associated RAMP protein Csm5 [Bacteroidota bacterium]
MNKQLIIETLSPVHIGNGRVLMGGIEHLVFNNEMRIAVLDDKKVLEVIGKDRINTWIAAINRGNGVLELLENVDRSLTSEKVAMRWIHINSTNIPSHQNNIREQIHSGNIKPMIPGSSLKGSFRTSWFSKEVLKMGRIKKTRSGMF